jgi:hypothetical protein
MGLFTSAFCYQWSIYTPLISSTSDIIVNTPAVVVNP